MRFLVSVLFIISMIALHGFAVHAEAVDFWLDMYDTELVPGDTLMLETVTMNEGDTIPEAAICVLLEVNGQFWCWPSWQSLDTGFDYAIRSIPDGRTKYWVLNTGWPDVPSAGIDLHFWGTVLDVNLTKLLAPVYKVTWTY